jgi:hypothetical protein
MAKSKHSEFFELIDAALVDGVEALEAGKTLSTREVELPDPTEDDTTRDQGS